MNAKKFGLLLLLIFMAFFGYCQDDVREDISTPDDYNHYLETISDSVQYLKDAWLANLTQINDNDHDYGKIKKPTNVLLKFIKDRRHDIKNLAPVGKQGDSLKGACIIYLNAELDAITKYYVPFVDIKDEADYVRLNNELKKENEQEQQLAEILRSVKESFENENNLNGEGNSE